MDVEIRSKGKSFDEVGLIGRFAGLFGEQSREAEQGSVSVQKHQRVQTLQIKENCSVTKCVKVCSSGTEFFSDTFDRSRLP